ncbi:alpha/beta fold hydrolase [Amantichitinum ursilacus]|uniref:Pimeloyl-[acyl-carrier protein] methyl ester esterase n=1 Tax=Amantichitinum ursilacus TaxID=857265 RepID=A0A0N0XHA3_9NEIS|nr:alpha/beta hydrolase [Amantichitinum ursilacus]KPC50681.1 Pimeloyl-[acyl-carrier protein] methyl ester esterase [Amantichitinum ursilacus]
MAYPLLTATICAAALLSASVFAADASQPAAASAPNAAAASAPRISVTVVGQGPDVVLIPGLASSRAVWADLAAQLKATHRLHLVQLAGFAGQPAVADGGDTVAAPAAEAIADYIQRNGLQAPVVIGHSLGGETALMLGARHPARVGRLIIVDALPFSSLRFNIDATPEQVTPSATAFRNTLLSATPQQYQAMQTGGMAQLVKSPAARPALLAAVLQSDRKTVADGMFEIMTVDLRPELKHITAPVDVVYAWDAAYGIAAERADALYQRAYAGTPNLTLKRIDDAFHFVMFDQPQAFSQTVIDWVNTPVPKSLAAQP